MNSYSEISKNKIKFVDLLNCLEFFFNDETKNRFIAHQMAVMI